MINQSSVYKSDPLAENFMAWEKMRATTPLLSKSPKKAEEAKRKTLLQSKTKNQANKSTTNLQWEKSSRTPS
jgi:hypothetical protein